MSISLRAIKGCGYVGSKAKVAQRVTDRPRVFGDESGCTGYSFDDGSTEHFTVALVIVRDADLLMRAVEAYHLRRWQNRRELHFKDMDRDARCHFLAFLGDLKDAPYEVRALVVNKKQIPLKARPATDKLYEHFVADAFACCGNSLAEAIAKMDKTNQGGRHVLSRIVESVNRETSRRAIHDLQFVSSHSNYAIQVADAYRGAVHKKYEKRESEYLEIVRKRVVITER